jgi:hypothetical protein
VAHAGFDEAGHASDSVARLSTNTAPRTTNLQKSSPNDNELMQIKD